ncbi:MAG: NADH-quinone oxidoreductase subunit E, partial [Aquificota bacterium]
MGVLPEELMQKLREHADYFPRKEQAV